MIKTIIFDFFDVIYTDALVAMLEKRSWGHDPEVERISGDLDLGVIDDDQLFARLAAVFNESADDLRAECETYNVLNEELIPVIEHLSRTYHVGLLSDAPSDFLRGLLRDHDLERLFHNITISSEVGMRKPDAAIFKHALSQLHAEATETVFIDDKDRNVNAAKELGMKGIVYTNLPTLLSSLRELGINLPADN